MAVCNTRNQKLGKKFGCFGNSQYFCKTKDRVRGRAEVARRAHNPEVVGSSPAPATKEKRELKAGFSLLFFELGRIKSPFFKSRNPKTFHVCKHLIFKTFISHETKRPFSKIIRRFIRVKRRFILPKRRFIFLKTAII